MAQTGRSTRLFAAGLLAGLAAGGLLYYLAFFLQAGNPPPKGGAKHAAIIQQKIHAAREIGDPKLILVGGSSVAYGISAEMLSRELNMPTYNFGLWASLGASYILHLAKSAVKKGDTVLLCLEYEMLNWDGPSKYWVNQEFIRFVLGVDSQFIESKTLKEKIWIALSLPPSAILSGLNSWRRGVEVPGFDFFEEYNIYGDSIENTESEKNRLDGSWRKAVRATSKVYKDGVPQSPKASEAVGEFLGWANQRGVRVFATFPNLARNDDYTEKNAIAAARAVKEMFRPHGVEVLGSPNEAMLPQELYFDTHYHLTQEGVKQRTKMLIPKLSNLILSPPPIAP